MTEETEAQAMKARIGARILSGELGPRAHEVARLDRSKPPPGYHVIWTGEGFGFFEPDGTRHPGAAWAWYWRRVAVADKLIDEDVRRVLEKVGDGCPLPGSHPWPAMLAWSDDQVAEVERWLVDSTAETPEVLRG